MPTVLVCGGRTYGYQADGRTIDRDLWIKSLRQLDKVVFDHWPYEYLPEIKVVTGEAKGADQIGGDYATEHWTAYQGYPADWDKYGKAAGYIRNKQMLDEEQVDLVVAFPGGRGTENMIKLAEQRNIKVVKIDGV